LVQTVTQFRVQRCEIIKMEDPFFVRASSSRNNAMSASTSGGNKRVYKERVLVRVYDLGRTFVTRWHNQVTKSYGAFHTGVEVYGREWSFGMTFDEYSTGVTWNAPGQNPDHSFRETLFMGYTDLSEKEVLKLVERLKVEWKGCSYNVLSRNCHCFSDTFCRMLGADPLPRWINDLADTGAQTVEYLDGADSGYDGGAAVVDFLGSLRDKVYSAIVGDPEEDERRPKKHGQAYSTPSYRPSKDLGLAARRPSSNASWSSSRPAGRQDLRLPADDPFLAAR